MLSKITITFYFLLLLSSCNTSVFEGELPKVLNIDNLEIESVNGSDEWAGMQGDGFIIEIFSLSETSIQAFEKKIQKKLPDKDESDKKWLKFDWSKTPVDTTYHEIFVVCLNYLSNNEKLNIKLDEVKKVLKNNEVYYSFYYLPDKDNPQSVQLFVLDIKNRKLYAIEQQI